MSDQINYNNKKCNSPGDIIKQHLLSKVVATTSLASTVLLDVINNYELLDPNVVYWQKATNSRIQGRETLQRISQQVWDKDFQTSDLNVQITMGRISTISPTSTLVQWNVTWVPPTALWWEGIGKILVTVPNCNMELCYLTYNHLAQRESTFSWNAVLRLLQDVIKRRKFKIPLACIEGSTEVQFSDNSNRSSKDDQQQFKVVRLTEDLVYAEDLRRRVLRNRKCAQDLRIFLETARCMIDDREDWYDTVAMSLPWQSVPGSGPLDVEPVEEGPMAAFVFVGVTLASIVLFASVLGPELIGQSLFGPTNYIVPPADLMSIY